MRPEGSRRTMGPAILATLAGLAAGAIAAYALLGGGAARSGPAEVAWDRQPCAHCGMLVGEPAFAAQLRTGTGETLFFDDPGCLLAYMADHPQTSGERYFHHLRQARWLRGGEAGFVPVPESPMGYRLGAVDRGTAVLDEEAARERVAAVRHDAHAAARED